MKYASHSSLPPQKIVFSCVVNLLMLTGPMLPVEMDWKSSRMILLMASRPYSTARYMCWYACECHTA